MFVSEYIHSLDAKGRLIIPSRFREALGDTFMVTKGLDGCLFIYDMAGWKVLEEKLRALPLTNTNARKFTRFMLGEPLSVRWTGRGGFCSRPICGISHT